MKSLTRPADDTGLDLILRLTLIELLLRPGGPWEVRPVILLVAAIGMIATPVLRTPLTWLALSLLIGIRIVSDWPRPDNHIYLLAYWCLSSGLALLTLNSRQTLAASGRILIGLVFALAVLWKGILSPDFVDERFFRVTFMTDRRFDGAILLLTDLTPQQLVENRQYLEQKQEDLFNVPELVEPPVFRWFAAISTYSTLAMEAAVAILFLVPLRGRFRLAAPIMLLFFCLATYPFAPVAGFGWLLLVMGLAQCQPEQRFLRYAYIVVYFVVLLITDIPWADALLSVAED